jgi:hypothetical protein
MMMMMMCAAVGPGDRPAPGAVGLHLALLPGVLDRAGRDQGASSMTMGMMMMMMMMIHQ